MLHPGLPHWLLGGVQFLWLQEEEAHSQYAVLLAVSSLPSAKDHCPPAVNTSPPTHLRPGLG